MMRHARPTFAALIGVAAVLTASPARAWWSAGHMETAGIAYDNLTPQTKAAVDSLLMRHKDYAQWIAALPAGYKDRGRYAFMKAATWPDDVRKTADDRPIWHYVDLPVIAPGYHPDPATIQPVKPNALTQLPIEASLLADRTATDGDRAIALCWVEHLVGDMHQPLHDASFFAPALPKGDRGGNSDLVAPDAVAGDPVEAAAHPHTLHALWDGLPGDTSDPATVDTLTARLETPAFARSTFPQLTAHTRVAQWADEGHALAQGVAYRDGTLPMTPDGDRVDVSLPADYMAQAHAVADRQVVLGGLRLADLLNATAFPGAPPAGK